MLTGVLLAVFIYWGWESAVNLSEESEDSSRAPGLAGIASTVILLVTYLAVAIALIAYLGLDRIAQFDDNARVLAIGGNAVLGDDLGKLLVIAVIVSGISSAQTTILPGSRTSLSMAAAGALPKAFASIHPRFLTPAFGTVVVGVLGMLWYVPGRLLSENFLTDSLSALSLLIAFYYGLTGLACAVYWRHELLRSAKNFLFIGVAPLLGAGMLTYLLIESARQLANPANSVHRAASCSGSGCRSASRSCSPASASSRCSPGGFRRPAEAREFFARRRSRRSRTSRDRRRHGRGDRDVRGRRRRRWRVALRTLIVGYDGSDARRRRSRRRSASPPRSATGSWSASATSPAAMARSTRRTARRCGSSASGSRPRRWPGSARQAIEAASELVAERPVDALTALADRYDARAIVVGTHGEHPAKAAFLGSTPHKLLHVSSRPVLVVPVPDEA